MKVAFFEVKEWEKDYLRQQLPNIEVSFFADALKQDNILAAADVDIVSCFAHSDMHENVLSKFTNLKMIATRSTGFDHIDVGFAKRKGIVVCNVPTYGENTVAEHTFALILDLSRKLHQSVARTKSGNFSLDGLEGFDLKGKTLGIVGMGHIGQHVARIANGFEMKALAFDVNQDKKLAKKLAFTYVSFDDILKNSDIITFHVPYNEHTRHLINLQNIGMIKKGAYIINTARGGVIETGALVKALADGIVAGAGLDVLEEENFLKEESHLLSKEFSKKYDLKTVLQDHILMEQENVIITPHNAFNAKEALERILETTVENIKGFIGNKVVNIVS